jgi:thymidine phosphorylase
VTKTVTADRDGYVVRLGALAIGTAAMRLGAGRVTKDDAIDHAVGIVCLRKRGDRVEGGEALAEIHASDESAAEAVVGEVQGAFELLDTAPPDRGVVLETLT